MELQNNNNHKINNLSDELFNEFLLTEKIIIEPKDLNHLINKTLEEKVISRTQQLSERNKELAILSLTDSLTNYCKPSSCHAAIILVVGRI